MRAEDRPGLDAPEIEGRIMAFMRRELLSPEVTVNRDDELLSGGVLDSIAVLRLATFVEEEFRLKMQPSDFVIENFQTVAVLVDYVRRTAGPGDRPPADSAR